MNKISIAVSAAGLLAAAGIMPALAQSATSGASSTTMPPITCRDLSALDQQTARSVVFYLGGLNAAQSSSSAMKSTTDTAASSGSTGSADGSSGSSTTADAGNSGSTSDTTGSTTTAGGSSATSGAPGTATVVAQLPGFAMIDADRVISTCQGSPDMQLSTVLGTSTTQ